MALANIPKDFSSRYLNDGFSGGEKKRMELLQLALLRPEIAVLDETDSGLDIDALRTVADGVNKFAGPDMGVLIITHYQRILHMVKPDSVHVMFEGRIVKEGGPELVTTLEEKGYGWISEEVGAQRRRDRLPPTSPPRPSSRSGRVPGARARGRRPAGRLSRLRRQRPAGAGLDRGGRRLRAPPPLERPPRRPHAVRRGDRALRGGAAHRRRPPRRRRPARADLRPQRDRGDQPGRPQPGATPTSAPATASLLTEMEHHSNLVPWQQLAERAGAEIDWVADRRRGPARYGRLRGAARARAEAGRRRPRLQRARDRQPARRDRGLAHDGRRAGAGRRRPGGAEAAARRRRARGRLLRVHRPQGLRRRPASAPSGAGSSCCARCRPSSAAAR